MPIFGPLYDRALRWATHRHAPAYLASLSFAESTVFPVPPDVMLVPMILARPERGWRLAALTTAASVLGGLVGYLIGYFAFESIEPWLATTSYWEPFQAAQASFDRWGFWFILVAGFSPIPFKVFTIASGVVGMPLVPFLAGSLAGRGGRFFLEAWLIKAGAVTMADQIRRHIEWLGWGVVIIVSVVLIYLGLR
ncbi:MAG: YqaA family protein [Xanthomonadales bacterium]|nr:YqaA family protein [Xanthomonadales bacterium]